MSRIASGWTALSVLAAASLALGAHAVSAAEKNRPATAAEVQQEAPAASDEASEQNEQAPEETVAPVKRAAPAAKSAGKVESDSENAADADEAAPPKSAAAAPKKHSDDDAAAAPAADGKGSGESGVANDTGSTTSSTRAAKVAASDLEIGTPVFGADGKKIGEVNRVTSNAAGNVEEIRVTRGGSAGLNSEVFAVPGSKISATKDGVKLSLSSDEVKDLPIIDKNSG